MTDWTKMSDGMLLVRKQAAERVIREIEQFHPNDERGTPISANPAKSELTEIEAEIARRAN